jgi:hypothetical protein
MRPVSRLSRLTAPDRNVSPNPQGLEVELAVALATALRQERARFRSRSTRLNETADEAIIKKVLAVVDSQCACVVRADGVGWP